MNKSVSISGGVVATSTRLVTEVERNIAKFTVGIGPDVTGVPPVQVIRISPANSAIPSCRMLGATGTLAVQFIGDWAIKPCDNPKKAMAIRVCVSNFDIK